MEALFFRFFKEVDARQLRFQRFESVAFEHDPRVYAFGYIRIDFRARELFQNGRALIGRRLQERGEAPCARSMERVKRSKSIPVASSTLSATP